MKSFWNALHKVGDKLHLPDMPSWLIAILALVMILRIPSLFEPYYYGDEMIYMSLGTGIRQGEILYKDIHDNKPPLLYWVAAIAGNLFMFKAILAFWSLATIYIFYKLTGKLLGKNQNGVKIGTLIFGLLTTLPFFEGNIANAELFMIGPSMLAFYILLSKESTFKYLLVSGILFSIGSLFKIPAAFEVPVIIVYWFMIHGIKEWKKILKQSIILSIGFAVPIVTTFIWYYFRGAFNEYLVAAYLQNLGYVHSWTVRDVPMGIRAGLVIFGILILWFTRNKISKNFIFVVLWTLFGLFGVVLSGRPYPHYFIQVVSSLSILVAIFLTDKTIEQSLTVIPLLLIFFVPVYYKFWIYPTSSYYLRFIDFSLGRINKVQYLNSFGEKTNRNYKIAEFLRMSSNINDKVFMWDPDSSTVYSLARRLPPIKFVADYHINDYSSKNELVDMLQNNQPKFIILTNNHQFTELKYLISKNYLLIQKIDDSSIYSRIAR